MENKGTILHADDDKSVRGLVKEFIENLFQGYKLKSFVDGAGLKTRLEELVSNPKDVKLVITDNEMPRIKGSEIIEQYAERLNIPFILAYGDVKGIGEKAIEDGAFDYLRKPFQINQFVDVVQRALDSYEK